MSFSIRWVTSICRSIDLQEIYFSHDVHKRQLRLLFIHFTFGDKYRLSTYAMHAVCHLSRMKPTAFHLSLYSIYTVQCAVPDLTDGERRLLFLSGDW